MVSTTYLPRDLDSQTAVRGSWAAHALLPCSRVLLGSLEPLAVPEAARGMTRLRSLWVWSRACTRRHVHVCVSA